MNLKTQSFMSTLYTLEDYYNLHYWSLHSKSIDTIVTMVIRVFNDLQVATFNTFS